MFRGMVRDYNYVAMVHRARFTHGWPLMLAAMSALVLAIPRPSDAAPFIPVGPGGGGAMFAPAISPHDPNLLFVACDMGGVYRSADGGRSWTMIDKRQLREATACPVFFHPRDARTLYAAGNGWLKTSADGGLTWNILSPGQPWGSSLVTALMIDDDEPTLMFAGTDSGAWRSEDHGRTWTACAGVTGRVAGIAIDPTTPYEHRICLIATSAGVFRSNDSGSTWHDSSAGLPFRDIRGFAGGGTAATGKFIAYCTLPSRSVTGQLTGGIWRSTDHGTTWQSAMGSGLNKDLGRADQYGDSELPQYEFVQCSRQRPETVYATVRGTGYWPPHHSTVCRSDDAGATWRAVVFTDPRMQSAVGIAPNVASGWIILDEVWGSSGGAPLGFGVSRGDANQALFTNDGEIYRTTDGGAHWAAIYSSAADASPAANGRWTSAGLEVTSAWQVAFDPRDAARAYICYTDIGLERSQDHGATWTHATQGMPWKNTVYQLAFDPDASGVQYAACSNQHDIPHWSNIEGPRDQGGVCVSHDAGATWSPLGTGLPNAPATSIVLDPRSPKASRTLYVTQYGTGVFKSVDGGATWKPTASQPGAAENRHVYRLKLCADGTLYCTITGKRDGDKFPVPGGLYRSRDGGTTWTELTTELGLRWPGDVDTPAGDSRTIYLGASSAPGYTQGGVYRSTDDGATWKRLLKEDDLPQELSTYAHAFFVTVDPRDPKTVYLGATTHGLFVTHDAGARWKEVPGLPFAGCQRVAFDPADPAALWVTTFGGGVWKGLAPP